MASGSSSSNTATVSSGGPDRRRTPPQRRKPSKIVADSKRVATPSWFNEAAGLACGALAIVLLVGVWQFGISGITRSADHFFGAAGGLAGRYGYSLWGAGAFVAVVGLAALGLLLWRTELEFAKQPGKIYLKFFTVRLLGALIVLSLASGLISALGGYGGSIGSLISQPMLHGLNVTGSVVMLAVGIVLGLSIATGTTVNQVLASLRHGIVWTVVDLPRLCWGLSVAGSIATYRALRALVWMSPDEERLIARREFEERQAEMETPAPKMRKNTLASQVEKEKLAPQSTLSEDEQDYSHVVVMRRDRAAAQSKREKERETQKRKGTGSAPAVPETDYSEAFPAYRGPQVDLLTKGEPTVGGEDDEELRAMSRQIELKLKDFGVIGRVIQVHPGPVITLFEYQPAPGIKINRISNLQEDLSMSLKASSLRIIAPLPKRGTVGIEVPNRKREIVRLRDIIESEQYAAAESLLTVGLGKDTYGDPVCVDLAAMPHLLIAGSTGTGKSVCINSILVSMLYRAHPSELGLILIDPKVLELSIYEDIPHLRVPVVTVPKQAKAVLEWAAHEMDRRYRMMQRFGVRSIDGYNAIVRGDEINPLTGKRQEFKPTAPTQQTTKLPGSASAVGSLPSTDLSGSEGALAPGSSVGGPTAVSVAQRLSTIQGVGAAEVGTQPADGSALLLAPDQQGELTGLEPINPEQLKVLPKIVIVIDELADLMLTVGRDIEELITRLAQKARASGIHLIIATQRPSVDVITGLIKANFPARLSFRVAQKVDSRTILDQMGAEKLLGKGDMLFMAPGADAVRRMHGAFVADGEVKAVVESIKETAKPTYDERILQLCKKALEDDAKSAQEGAGGGEVGGEGDETESDPFYDRAVEIVLQKGQASTSMLQRAFRIGYNRAARLIELMEKEGLIGPADGARPREVLVQSITPQAD